MADLTDDELTELECAILDACEEKRREGWTIVPGCTFDRFNKKCCPMGATFGREPYSDDLVWVALRDAIGHEYGFDEGFDGEPLTSQGAVEFALYNMGRRFRERLERGEL